MQEKQIEVEFRSRIAEDKFRSLKKYLRENSEDLGEDDKNSFFFLLPDRVLKVAENVSQNSAKVVLKMNRIGRGSDAEEIEIPIAREQAGSFVYLLERLNLGKMIESFQKRHNYMFHGVELALKYSEHWGYHVELEVLIADPAQKEAVEEKIRQVAAELELPIMSDQEIIEFTTRLEGEYFGKKSPYS